MFSEMICDVICGVDSVSTEPVMCVFMLLSGLRQSVYECGSLLTYTVNVSINQPRCLLPFSSC